ncbi:MAG: zinc-ribbon domain-containing protein [Anaerolineae bacterium]|nr:zinc-ribbon domain-containing protein [Anaerolineae bacterium]
MFCDRCGLPLLGTEEFCPQCGAELRRGAPPEEAPAAAVGSAR